MDASDFHPCPAPNISAIKKCVKKTKKQIKNLWFLLGPRTCHLTPCLINTTFIELTSNITSACIL